MSCFGRCFNNFQRNIETNFSNSLRQIRVHNYDQVDLTKSVKIPDKMAKRLGKINVIFLKLNYSKYFIGLFQSGYDKCLQRQILSSDNSL